MGQTGLEKEHLRKERGGFSIHHAIRGREFQVIDPPQHYRRPSCVIVALTRT